MKRRIWMLAVVCVCAGIVPLRAHAQETGQAQRDVITQPELLKEREAVFPTPPKPPVVEEEAEKPALPPEGPSFLVKRIVLEGNTVFPQKDLMAYAKDFEGRKLSLRDLQKFADLVSAHYRKAGYTTSRAYIPPQKIVDDTVVVKILEARVGDIAVTGNRWFAASVYQDALPFKKGAFFEMADIDNALREINAQPDRSARAYLEPGKVTGTTDITLKAKDEFPIHLSYEFNRRGTELTFLPRHLIHLTHNNLTGHGDIFQSRLTMAQEGALLGSVFGYQFPWQKTGTTFRLDASVAESKLQKQFRPLDIQGKVFNLVPGVTQRLWQNERMELDGNLQFEYLDSKTLQGTQKLSYDRMRVITVGPQMTINDGWGRTILGANAHVGIPGFMGGSDRIDSAASRPDSGGQFAFWTGALARIQPLPLGTYLVAQAGGQLSADPLTIPEQFFLGGMYSVRGYPENDSAGDEGWNFSTELRVPPYMIPASWRVAGTKDKTWRDALSLVGFVEGGQTFNKKRQLESSVKKRTLLGTGFGLKFYVTPDFNVQTDVGFPFGNKPTDEGPQVHLVARFGF